MGVFEAGDGAGFLAEAAEEFGVFGELAGEDFEGNLAIHGGVVGFVDGCHAALADLLDDAIGAEGLTGLDHSEKDGNSGELGGTQGKWNE